MMLDLIPEDHEVGNEPEVGDDQPLDDDKLTTLSHLMMTTPSKSNKPLKKRMRPLMKMMMSWMVHSCDERIFFGNFSISIHTHLGSMIHAMGKPHL